MSGVTTLRVTLSVPSRVCCCQASGTFSSPDPPEDPSCFLGRFGMYTMFLHALNSVLALHTQHCKYMFFVHFDSFHSRLAIKIHLPTVASRQQTTIPVISSSSSRLDTCTRLERSVLWRPFPSLPSDAQNSPFCSI